MFKNNKAAMQNILKVVNIKDYADKATYVTR